MIYTDKQLKVFTNALAKTNNVTTQEVLQNFMFERILFRISKSKYAKKIILKGGLLVSSISGISSRTTMDMDAMVKGIKLDKEKLVIVLNDILSIDAQDGIQFELLASEVIREEEEYGGFRFKFQGLLGRLKVSLSIDLSTGDIITPDIQDYPYPMIFEKGYINIKAYPIETILAEKIQTILDRNGAKGRMKDYYDVYYFVTNRLGEINIEVLQRAVQNTFSHRNTLSDLDKAETILVSISENEVLRKRWIDYAKKHEYSKHLRFEDVIETSSQLVIMIQANN